MPRLRFANFRDLPIDPNSKFYSRYLQRSAIAPGKENVEFSVASTTDPSKIGEVKTAIAELTSGGTPSSVRALRHTS